MQNFFEIVEYPPQLLLCYAGVMVDIPQLLKKMVLSPPKKLVDIIFKINKIILLIKFLFIYFESNHFVPFSDIKYMNKSNLLNEKN